MKKIVVILLALCVFTSLAFANAGAENATSSEAGSWRPTSAVTLYVSSAPGGGHDNTARLWAQCAEKYAGVPINIVNETAGSGVVCFNTVMNAPKDGYTLGQGAISINTDQYLVDGAAYTPNDFIYVGLDATDANYLVVSAKGPYANMTVKEFLDYAKKNPGKVRMGISGNWTNHDYTRYLVEKTSGASFNRVSIKGGANIVLGILNGDIDCGVPYPSEVAAQVEAGNLKILALTGNTRSPFWPDAPTFTESGYEINLAMWRAIMLPAGTPQEIVDGWIDIYKKTMEDPETIAAYEAAGVTYSYLPGVDQARAYVEESHKLYKSIIDTGVVKAK